MAVSILKRPIEFISNEDGLTLKKSLYNASGGEIPTVYEVSNTLFPTNYAIGARSIISVTNISNRSELEFSNSDYNSIVADDRFEIDTWISLVADGEYFIGQIVSFDAVNYKILTTIPYDTLFASSVNEFNWYAKDYEVLINVYVGLNPNHPSYSEQPNEFIAQRSLSAFVVNDNNTTNITNCDITGLIKNVITQTFEDKTETGINLDQYTQFRIEYAETYKRINPATLQNEVYDGTNYQSAWVRNQPTFTEDSFSCGDADLLNEEFTTDLSDWTNDDAGLTQWVWNAGTAQASLTDTSPFTVSSHLSQPFAYVEDAYYTHEINISYNGSCSFNVLLEGDTTSYIIHRELLDGSGSTIISYSFQASRISARPPELPIKVKFRVYNSSDAANVVNIEYFRQTQSDEGCLPYINSVYAVRQFGNPYAGSMGDLEGTLAEKGEFLTDYTTKILNPNDINAELSLIGNSSTTNSRIINIVATVEYSNGETFTYNSESFEYGEGLYRVMLNRIIQSISTYLSENNTTVKNITLNGVSEVNNLFTDWTEGTFEDCACPFTYINPDSIGAGNGVTDNTENPYVGLKSAKITGEFDFDVVDTSWNRFAHGNLYLPPATVSPRSGDWINEQADADDLFTDTFGGTHVKSDPTLYTSTISQITTNDNCNAYYGCFSTDTYNSYSLTGKMFSNNADNDSLAYVIAFTTDGGVEHTLSLIATTGGNILDLNPSYVFGDDQTSSIGFTNTFASWALVYDFGKSGAQQLNEFVTTKSGYNWNSAQVGDLMFQVDRNNDDIVISVDWIINSEQFTNTFNYNLQDNAITTKFSGSQSIGFGFVSQDQGGFKDVEFNTLGGGILADGVYTLAANSKYYAEAFIDISEYIDQSMNESYVQVGFFDTSDVLITSNTIYNPINTNTNGYQKIISEINTTTETEVKIGVYKGGTNAAAGAQAIYIDNIKLVGPSIDITDPLPSKWVNSDQCNSFNMKWLNSLGGWDNYTFEAGKREEVVFSDNTRYNKEVLGNWSAEFTTGSGIGFEQSIKWNQKITVRTRVINTELKKTLSKIKTSIHVVYYNEELSRYMTCLVDKSSFTVYEERKGTYRFEFDILLADKYVQTA